MLEEGLCTLLLDIFIQQTNIEDQPWMWIWARNKI